MDLEKITLDSSWWASAQQAPDRHYPPDSGVSVADHLLGVHKMVQLLLERATGDPYLCQLRQRLDAIGMPATLA